MKQSFRASELLPGQEYRVIKEFRDFDEISQRVDERWRFLSKSFLPHDDGLSLLVEIEGKERHIRLQWRPEAQSEIIENFHDYADQTQ